MKATKRSSERAQSWGDKLEQREQRREAEGVFMNVAHATGRARAKRAQDGLVIAAYLSIADDGRLVQCHLPGIAPEPDDTRGECDGFSADSQRRLLRLLHTIRRDAALPTMVTLTFPEELTVTPWEAKACRRAFAKRCRKAHPKWCALWRLEAHPELSNKLGRVHPHFHLLTWGAWYNLAWVSDVWTDIVWKVLRVDYGVTDEDGKLIKVKHLQAGTNCEKVRKWEGVIYCSKSYIAKDEEYPLGKAGRVWGWDWRDNLPLSKVRQIPLNQGQATAVRIAIEEWMREQRIQSDYLLCTFFDNDPAMFVARLLAKYQPCPLRPKT